MLNDERLTINDIEGIINQNLPVHDATPIAPARAVRTAISTLRNFPKSNFAAIIMSNV